MSDKGSSVPGIERLFAGESYGATAFCALMALVPFLIVEGAKAFIVEEVANSLGTDRTCISFSGYLGTAAYAFGALLGGDLVRRFYQRRLFLTVHSVSVLGWVFMSASPSLVPFAAAQVVTGFCGGALLVIALPPLLQKFPASKIPYSAFFVNFGLFGAVAAGPLVGGLVTAAGPEAWRWFVALFAATGTVVLVAAMRHLPGGPPKDPERDLDRTAIVLTFFGTVLPFVAIGLMPVYGLLSVPVLALLVIGLGSLAALILAQYRSSEPLAPIRKALNSFMVMGLVIATIGGGVFITSVSILSTIRQPLTASSLELGLSFWPQLLGLTIAAALFGFVIRTKALFPLILCGLAAILIGPALLLTGAMMGDLWFSTALFVIGFGAGATVSPGLLVSAISMPVSLLAGVIAIIELARAIGNFMAAPVLIDASRIVYASANLQEPGAILALTILLAITGAGVLFSLVLFFTAGSGLPKAAFEPWIAEGKPAFDSPPLFARLRR
ncbi:MFS transporter [Fulvimarina sp. MAC3]|uniref:MFS transporter n=1 Tax=Fulvimarina sp. MAC3 TaxID=3148887 RepID=UPI0031FC59C1